MRDFPTLKAKCRPLAPASRLGKRAPKIAHGLPQTKFMFEFNVSPHECRTALASFELPNIDLESIEPGTLSKAQAEWCFLIIRKKQPLLSSARQEAFALRFKELGMCQPLESWEPTFGEKKEAYQHFQKTYLLI